MKKYLSLAAISLVILLAGANPLSAQDSKKERQEATIKGLIDAQHYTFDAQTAIPLKLKIRHLANGYYLIVAKDRIEAYLPYFGQAYSAPIASANSGGIEFKTSDFEYTVTPKKKGGWDIKILPKKAGDTRQLFLTVTTSGYASLQVTSTNRQFISFNGYIH